ncbi:MAG: hypothetical protein WCO54_00185 [Bacteroidota bacterium]
MKTENIIRTFIFTAILFLQQCQCKKNDTVTPVLQCTSSNSVLFPQDMKDRFYFNVGTYWIYKNIKTNDIDSMWIWKSSIATTPVDPKMYGTGFNKCYESFAYLIRNPLTANGDKYYSSISILLSPNKNQQAIELFGLSDFYLSNQISVYRVDNRGGKYENQEGETMSMVDSILTLDNIIYKNILRLYYPVGTQTFDYLLDAYYAKNVGLVKFKRRIDNTEWELIRYHIVQ